MTEFEASIIARFFSFKTQFTRLALLNRRWLALVRKHYSWNCFPEPGPYSLLTDFVRFFDSFDNLSGVHIPYFSGLFLNDKRIKRLESEVRSLGMRIERVTQFKLISEHLLLLAKLKELTI